MTGGLSSLSLLLCHDVIAQRISYGTRNLVDSNSLATLASVIDACHIRNARVTDLLGRQGVLIGL
jgi:hypothetical protein